MKLTPDQRAAILKLKSKLHVELVAERFNIHKNTVWKIWRESKKD